MKTPRSETGYCNGPSSPLADKPLFLSGFSDGTQRAAFRFGVRKQVPAMRFPTFLMLALALAAPPAIAQGTPPSDPPAASKPAAATSSVAAPAEQERKRRLRFRDDKASCAPGSLGEADIQSIVTNKSGMPATPKGNDK